MECMQILWINLRVPLSFPSVKEYKMTRIEQKLRFSDEQFKHQAGTTKQVFQAMLEIL